MSDTTPVVAVRRAEARTVQENPAGPAAPLKALRTVILWTFADAFGLATEEIMWTGYHLDNILSPLKNHQPVSVPLAVRHEMLDGFYTRELNVMETRDDRNTGGYFDAQATHASVSDWAQVTIQMVSESYRLRPLNESAMYGAFVGLLRELGVDNPHNPRASRYLPNDLRHRLNRQRF